MIKEDFVSFEVAKLLKEKGFDEPCVSKYCTDGSFDRALFHYKNSEINKDACNAPTHQMAMKWLREKYHLHIWIDYSRLDCDEKQPYLWNIVETKIDGNYWGGTYHKKYEEAAELAIKYTLENLI